MKKYRIVQKRNVFHAEWRRTDATISAWYPVELSDGSHACSKDLRQVKDYVIESKNSDTLPEHKVVWEDGECHLRVFDKSLQYGECLSFEDKSCMNVILAVLDSSVFVLKYLSQSKFSWVSFTTSSGKNLALEFSSIEKSINFITERCKGKVIILDNNKDEMKIITDVLLTLGESL